MPSKPAVPQIAASAPRARGERCCNPGAAMQLGKRGARSLSDDLALLAHPVRLQILDVLAQNPGRVCVCDLEAAVPVKQPTVSHHLRILRQAGVVHAERQGVWMYYVVNRDVMQALRGRITAALAGLG